MEIDQLKKIVEAALLAAEQPLNLNHLAALFDEDGAPAHSDLKAALDALSADCADRGIELTKVASGYRLQVRQEMQQWVSRLWAERRPRYSRALLETLAIIAYRQPMTRGEIEEIRGVSVSSNIMRTLQEREWVRIVGHRDVPGRPALFGTTRRFLDYFSLSSLDGLPTLAEIRDLEDLEPELELMLPTSEDGDDLPGAEAGEADQDLAASEMLEGDHRAAAEDSADEVDADQAHQATEEDNEDGQDAEEEPDPTPDYVTEDELSAATDTADDADDDADGEQSENVESRS